MLQYYSSRQQSYPCIVLASIEEKSDGDIGRQVEWLIHDHCATLSIWCCTFQKRKNQRRNKDLPHSKEPMLLQEDEVPS